MTNSIRMRHSILPPVLLLSVALVAGCSVPPDAITPGVADIVAKVEPSVVAINTEVEAFDLFNQPTTGEGAGSGWVIREDGVIVTNYHVVQGAKSITVTLEDGRTFPVDLDTVSIDPLTDLAVFKIDAENLPAATVGDSSKLRVGDAVLALGNSLGQGTTATKGIVSALGVSLSLGQTLYGLIQTDADITPGYSGGPLVNMAGEVIGIMKFAEVDAGFVVYGYAMGTNEASPIIEELIENGHVVRPWLGVQISTVDTWAVHRYDLPVTEGVLVTEVVPGSPADEAGLEEGDVITGFLEQEITEADQLIRAIHSCQVGQRVKIIFWRVGTKDTIYVILAESPPPS